MQIDSLGGYVSINVLQFTNRVRKNNLSFITTLGYKNFTQIEVDLNIKLIMREIYDSILFSCCTLIMLVSLSFNKQVPPID